MRPLIEPRPPSEELLELKLHRAFIGLREAVEKPARSRLPEPVTVRAGDWTRYGE